LSDEPEKIGAGLPRAILFACAGETLSAAERSFFTAADPLGFILFHASCRDPGRVRDLVAALRDSVGRDNAPVLVDQEGGRVARLRPPHWRRYPSAARLAALPDPLAEEAARLGARLMGDDLAALGITVDCTPVLDLPIAGADPVIGDRAYGPDPVRTARLGRAVCEGLLAGGVLPVVKHIPGHGRASVDSHRALPVVEAGAAELEARDFAPFHALADMPWAMTAHVVYPAFDPHHPATVSAPVIERVIRGTIGFDGVLVSDDLGMGALSGTAGERVRDALTAGCDLAMHCQAVLGDMEVAAAAATPIRPATAARLARAEALRRASHRDFDRAAAEARFDALLGGGE
jgi:beta-N-acetylhexosaminidase